METFQLALSDLMVLWFSMCIATKDYLIIRYSLTPGRMGGQYILGKIETSEANYIFNPVKEHHLIFSLVM